MKNSNKSKMIPILGILIVLGSAGYYFFGKSEPVETTLLSREKVGASANSIQGDLIRLLGEVNQLKLNREDSVLKSGFVRQSVDFTKDLVPEPKARPNPFAPIGTDVGRVNAGIRTPSVAPVEPVATTTRNTPPPNGTNFR